MSSFYLNNHYRKYDSSRIKPFKPSEEASKKLEELTETDGKTNRCTLPLFALIFLLPIPFAAFHTLMAVDLSIALGVVYMGARYVANGYNKVQNDMVLRPTVERFVNKETSFKNLNLVRLNFYYSTLPETDKEFFDQVNTMPLPPQGIKRALPPIAFTPDGRKLDSPPHKYDVHFEDKASEYEKSSISHLGRAEPEWGRIGFVNGMGHNYVSAYQHILHLSRLADGANVHLIHNPHHGYQKDALECYQGSNGKVTAPSWHVIHDIVNFCEDPQNEGKKYLLFCHSQGAIHVRNMEGYLPDKYKERVVVVGIAPGGYIPEGSKLEAYYYISPRDPVPHIDGDGKQKAKNVYSCDINGIYTHGFFSDGYGGPILEHIDRMKTEYAQKQSTTT